MNKKVLIIIGFIIALCIGSYYFLNNQEKESGVEVAGVVMNADKDIIANLSDSGYHLSFVSLLEFSETNTSMQNGSYTVFAPSDTAFETLEPDGLLTTLIEPQNAESLKSLVSYHIVPGIYTSSGFIDGMKVKTLNGQELSINKRGTKWYVNDIAEIRIVDAPASNGVIHVIDTVLQP